MDRSHPPDIAHYYDHKAEEEWERLERAAVCLPHCDRGRFLAVLRGDQKIGVL